MWIKVTEDELRTHLSAPERQALASAAVDTSKILNDEIHNWTEAWRGRLRKNHVIDKRKDYVPSELLQFVLIHIRYSSFTRLPQMESLLDYLRQKEWDRANRIFDDPDLISWEDPEQPEEDDTNGAIVDVPPRNYALDTY